MHFIAVPTISDFLNQISYPLVYTITTVPVAAARFSAFHNEHVPFQVTVFAVMVFSLSGFFNVVLFTLTRPALIPRGEITSSLGHTTNRMSLHIPQTSPVVTRPSIALGTLRSRSDPQTGVHPSWSTSPNAVEKQSYDNRSDLAISIVSSTDLANK